MHEHVGQAFRLVIVPAMAFSMILAARKQPERAPFGGLPGGAVPRRSSGLKHENANADGNNGGGQRR